MRIIENWQYRYIEKCLFNYNQLVVSNLDTEFRMTKAINKALEFFKGSLHEKMIHSFYFEADLHRKRFTKAGHYRWVCSSVLHTEEPNGYVIRREIVYKIAMNCYALGVFKLE